MLGRSEPTWTLKLTTVTHFWGGAADTVRLAEVRRFIFPITSFFTVFFRCAEMTPDRPRSGAGKTIDFAQHIVFYIVFVANI